MGHVYGSVRLAALGNLLAYGGCGKAEAGGKVGVLCRARSNKRLANIRDICNSSQVKLVSGFLILDLIAD